MPSEGVSYNGHLPQSFNTMRRVGDLQERIEKFVLGTNTNVTDKKGGRQKVNSNLAGGKNVTLSCGRGIP